jgi:CheY-like chemotaxis protein
MHRGTPFVLVVDSHPDAAASTCDVLALHGFTAVPARSCAEALETAHARMPVAVVTELWLPDGDGNGLADRLREMGRPVPAVIAVSESPPEARSGFDAHFVKPADPRALVGELRRFVPEVVTGPGRWHGLL